MGVLRTFREIFVTTTGRFFRWMSISFQFWRYQDGAPYRERSFEPYESDSEEDRTDTPVQDLDFNFRNAGYHSGPGSNATWLKVVT